MNKIFFGTRKGSERIKSHHGFLCLLFFIFILFSGENLVHARESQQAGEACNAKNKLSPSFICVEDLLVDCRVPNGSREQLYCSSNELQKTDAELNRLYQSILKKLTKPNDEYADYKSAQRSFTEAQRAWLKFKKSDCEVSGYLNLKGSIQSNEVINCELKHTKNRINDFAVHFTYLK